jgi:hypothetical protein
MFTPDFFLQPTGLSMSDFVNPGALSQEDFQKIFDFWSAMRQQQSGLTTNAQVQAHQQPEQEISRSRRNSREPILGSSI